MIDTVYAYLCRYEREHGFAPSIREIAAGCYTSTGNVVRYLDRLEAQGRISRMMGKARSIRLLDTTACAPEKQTKN